MELSDEFVLELTQAQQSLLSYIYRRVANRDQAQEVLQQTNLVLCRKADKFELGTNFNAWAVTMARYQILSHRRNVARDRLVFTDEVFAVVDDRDLLQRVRHATSRHATPRHVTSRHATPDHTTHHTTPHNTTFSLQCTARLPPTPPCA